MITKNRFSVVVIKKGEFWNNFSKIDFKLHDCDGIFGYMGWDYFVYKNTKEQKELGSSKVYLLLHTKRSLENMREEKIKNTRQRMKRFGINIDDIIRSDDVIVAIDQTFSKVNNNTITLKEQ